MNARYNSRAIASSLACCTSRNRFRAFLLKGLAPACWETCRPTNNYVPFMNLSPLIEYWKHCERHPEVCQPWRLPTYGQSVWFHTTRRIICRPQGLHDECVLLTHSFPSHPIPSHWNGWMVTSSSVSTFFRFGFWFPPSFCATLVPIPSRPFRTKVSMGRSRPCKSRTILRIAKTRW